jgi:hypothetical protein
VARSRCRAAFEQLIVRDQTPSAVDQIREDRKGLRHQQDVLLLRPIAAPPQTLVRNVEPESTKDFHRPPAARMNRQTDFEQKLNIAEMTAGLAMRNVPDRRL